MWRTKMSWLGCVVVLLVACGTDVAQSDSVSEWSSDTAAVLLKILPIGGSGQVNGNFQVAELSDVQIGLRAYRRFSPVPLDRSGADYYTETGESSPGEPLWNYDFTLDLVPQDGESLAPNLSVGMTVNVTPLRFALG